MNMLPIERIFVPLLHGSKDRRDIGLPAVARLRESSYLCSMAAKIEEILASLLLPADSDWQVESFEKNEANESIYVKVRFSKPEVTVAGKKFPIYDFRPERTWRHLDLWQCQTYITARIPRYRVDGKILSLDVPWADAGERLTSMLEKKR